MSYRTLKTMARIKQEREREREREHERYTDSTHASYV